MKAYCDTSFLVSLYTPDANSAAALVARADVLYSFDATQRRLASAAGLASAPRSD